MITLRLASLLSVAMMSSPVADPGGANPLTLGEVLDSTRRNYPPLLAAIREIEIAEADRRAAFGEFDLGLGLGASADRRGFYENERLDLRVEQAVQWWGAKLYAGWRLGQGGFAPYDGSLETRDEGAFLAGIKLPLLRGRAVDSARAELRRAQVGITLAELSVSEQRLLIEQLATWSYWDWVAAGRALGVARGLLDLALDRDEFLRESVEAGALPAIEVTDNRRAILKRRSDVVSAEQKLLKASIYLSLYLRDGNGDPVVPSFARLPEDFPEPVPLELDRLADETALALERRPDLLSVRAQTDRIRVDEGLYRNQTLPSLDLSVGVSAEGGDNPDVKRGPNDVKAALTLSFPVQRREADGKLRRARAKLAQLAQKERFIAEKVAVEVRDAATAVDASYRKTVFLDEEVSVTRELEGLERERFDLGDSNLFTVNLREIATADAELRRIEALADFYRALALYRLVTAAP